MGQPQRFLFFLPEATRLSFRYTRNDGGMQVTPDLKHPKRDSDEAVVRQMMTREDELTNQRMLWMAAFNGLLFAALGFAFDKPGAGHIAIVFCILGFTTSLLNGLAVIFASHAQRRLLYWWRANKPEHYTGPGVMGLEPLDNDRSYSMYFSPWILLAFTFAVGWLAILHFEWIHAM